MQEPADGEFVTLCHVLSVLPIGYAILRNTKLFSELFLRHLYAGSCVLYVNHGQHHIFQWISRQGYYLVDIIQRRI